MSIMLVALLLIITIIGLSAGMIGSMLNNNFVNSATQTLNRNVSGGRNYINSVMLSAANLANDSELITELDNNTNKPLTQMLDNACSYALKINAITVYATDGRIYTSSGIASVPTLTELRRNEDLFDYFTLDNSECVSMRNEEIAEFYNNSAYDSSLGIISCCHKIFAEDSSLLGYVFCDIFPYVLYGFFENSSDDETPSDATLTMLRFDDGFFPYNNNGKYLDDFKSISKSNANSSDGKYLIIPNTRNFFGGTISVAFSLDTLRFQILCFILLLIAIGFGVLLIINFIVRMLSSRVTSKLTGLITRMDRDEFIEQLT